MATASIPISPQAPTVPSASTLNVGTFAGKTATLKSKKTGCSAKEQESTPAPAGTSAFAEVPCNSRTLTVQPPIVLLPANETLAFLGVKPINDMTLDEKFACLKQCFAYGYGVRKVLVEVFESIVAEYKTYVKDRKGTPTVEEAFKQRGLNYKTVYSAIQREKERRTEDAKFFAELKAQTPTNNIHGLEVTDDDLPPIGEKVVDADGRRAVVLTHGVADGGCKTVEVVYEDDGTSEILKAGSLVRLAEVIAAKAAAKAAKGNRKSDNGRKGSLDAQSLKNAYYADRYKEVIALMTNKPKDAKAEDVLAQIEAEAIRAYEDMDAEEAKSLRIPKPKHTKLEQMGIKLAKLVASKSDLGRTLPRTASNGWKLLDLASDLLQAAGEEGKANVETLENASTPQVKAVADGSASGNPKAATVKATKTEKVLVARVGDTNEFGVFPESCVEHTTANALTIGTKQVCEAERDRINAKRAANAGSVEALHGTAKAQMPQTAVSVQ
jgi:hypothetical protein